MPMFLNSCLFESLKFFSFLLFFEVLFCTHGNMSSTEILVSVDFEVFGKVQGVFFRKFTEKEATRLGLKGWCMNTNKNTVKGVIEGTASNLEKMKWWLQKGGSPASRIDKAVFTNEKDIKKHTYDSFKIKR